MSKKILIVAATPSEAEVLGRIPGIRKRGNEFVFRNSEISLLITGVGSAATSWGMSKWISANPKPELAINIGISGSYRKEIGIGEVVAIQSDCFADAGLILILRQWKERLFSIFAEVKKYLFLQ
jgi:futalosine hydrolase